MKKKGKMTMTITIGLMCFLLTLVIFIQFKTISQTDISQIETMREHELRTEIASVKTKYEELSKQLEDTNSKIEEYNKAINSEKEASELLENELKQSNNILGKNEVEGERNNCNTYRHKV